MKEAVQAQLAVIAAAEAASKNDDSTLDMDTSLSDDFQVNCLNEHYGSGWVRSNIKPDLIVSIY